MGEVKSSSDGPILQGGLGSPNNTVNQRRIADTKKETDTKTQVGPYGDHSKIKAMGRL